MEVRNSDAVKDTLVVDRYVNELNEYAALLSQLGDQPKALMLNKAARVIQTLSDHCMTYNVGIPAMRILRIVEEK